MSDRIIVHGREARSAEIKKMHKHIQLVIASDVTSVKYRLVMLEPVACIDIFVLTSASESHNRHQQIMPHAEAPVVDRHT